MIFLVFNDGIEWSLDFGPDSVTLTVKDLVHEMLICFQEFPLAAWSLLLSQKQKFLNNRLEGLPVTPKQQGTDEMRDEVLSSVGAQEMDTTGYQVSAELDDVEFYWENDQLDVDAVFRTGIDTLFSPTAFDDFELGGSAENPILPDEEEYKENSLPTTTPASERPTRPLHCWEVVHLEQEKKVFLIMFMEICFNRYYGVYVLIYVIINVFHFIITFFKN